MFAQALERLIEEAEEPPTSRRYGSVIQASRSRVRESRPVMLTIISQLRAGAPIDPGAMAALGLLLTDGAGVLYGYGNADLAKARLEAITRSLDAPD